MVWLVLTAEYFKTKYIYVLHILVIRRDKQPSTFVLGFDVFCEVRNKYFYSIEEYLFMEVVNINSV